MKNYNYEVKSTGEVITFGGNYRSSRGQAAAITFYMFVGMLCCGLVFSIALPGGNLWYLLTLLTPVAPWYYYQNADRCAHPAVPSVLPPQQSILQQGWTTTHLQATEQTRIDGVAHVLPSSNKLPTRLDMPAAT